jgi:manganese/zinc/iron transport system permease protein
MMAVVAGLLFSLAWLLAPRYGLLPRWLTRKTLSLRIAGEDIIAGLYRHAERCGQRPATAKVLKQELGPRPWPSGLILWWLSRLGLVKWESTGWSLTETGLRSARGIVRSHRLWETYLVHQAGTEVDRIHEMAERLEHFTGPELRERLDQVTPAHDRDPHGSPIPPE